MKTQDNNSEYESKSLPSSVSRFSRFRLPFRHKPAFGMSSSPPSAATVSHSPYSLFNFSRKPSGAKGATPRKSVSFSGMDWKKKVASDHTDVAYREAVNRLRSILSPRPHNLLESSSLKGSLGDLSTAGQSAVSPPASRRNVDRFNLRSIFSNKESPPTKPLNNQLLYAYNAPTSGCEEDLFDFINKQGEYINQLEKETKYCREDLANMLDKVRDVISENEALHDRQKRELLNNMIDQLDEKTDGYGGESKGLKRGSIMKKHPSNLILESKIAEMEAQLTQAKRSLQLAQQEILDLKKNKNTSAGLSQEHSLTSVNPYAHCDLHRAEIENLNREKQDLLETLSKFKLMMSDLRDRESDAAKKVKHSLDIVETMQNEKAQSDLETRRLKDELERHQQRLRDLVTENCKKVHEEKMQVEMKYRQEIEMLNSNMNVEMDSLTRTRLDLERLKRAELELKREVQIKSQTIEDLRQENLIRMGHMQSELSQALLMKSQAEQDLINSRLLIEKAERDNKQEMAKLQAEITALRQRVETTDTDLINAQELVAKLNENITHLQRENTILKTRDGGEDTDVVNIIHNMEEKQSKDMTDLEELIQAQNALLDKLRGECKMLTNKLEDTSKQTRRERMLFERERERLLHSGRLGQERRAELEKRVEFYTSSHEQMAARLRKLEDEDKVRSERDLMVELQSCVSSLRSSDNNAAGGEAQKQQEPPSPNPEKVKGLLTELTTIVEEMSTWLESHAEEDSDDDDEEEEEEESEEEDDDEVDPNPDEKDKEEESKEKADEEGTEKSDKKTESEEKDQPDSDDKKEDAEDAAEKKDQVEGDEDAAKKSDEEPEKASEAEEEEEAVEGEEKPQGAEEKEEKAPEAAAEGAGKEQKTEEEKDGKKESKEESKKESEKHIKELKETAEKQHHVIVDMNHRLDDWIHRIQSVLQRFSSFYPSKVAF